MAEAEHEGDVAALRFVSAGDERLLVTASSAGGVLAFRVSSSSSSSSTGDEQAPVLARVDLPQWAAVFGVYGATALDVSESGATIVSASAGGALAWLALDETMSVATIGTHWRRGDAWGATTDALGSPGQPTRRRVAYRSTRSSCSGETRSPPPPGARSHRVLLTSSASSGLTSLSLTRVCVACRSAPGSQLRIWDIAASNLFPVTVCSE